jgi:hypothetical protein
MANPEHLETLKQGWQTWNNWRDSNPDVVVCLQGANLKGAQLSGFNFSEVNLSGGDLARASLRNTNFSGANLAGVDLRQTELFHAVLRRADLRDANLGWGIFRDADFAGANLAGANLYAADLQSTNFRETILDNAYLCGAYLGSADLSATTFVGAKFGLTHFGATNLTGTTGLEKCEHLNQSFLDHHTLQHSVDLPIEFLRGCGLSDWQIESAKLYQPELSNEEITTVLYRVRAIRAHQAIQISPLFISYSHADSPFVDELENHLNEKGIRFWRDIHHATAGRLETQIDRAIRINPTVLLILSSHSVESDWVQHEARLARKLELEIKRDVLCPLAIDDSWKDCHWPERLREQIMEYNILDFSDWKNEDTFRRMFGRLIDGLDLFYK